GFHGDVLQLCPVHELAVIDPFGDHADAAHNAAFIGKNLVAGGSHEVAAAGSNRLYRGDHLLVLFLLDAAHFLVNLLRRGHAPPGVLMCRMMALMESSS